MDTLHPRSPQPRTLHRWTLNRRTLNRRTLLRASLLAAGATALPGRLARGAAADPPQTGFEQRSGGSWTTHEEELAFLEAVVAGGRAAIAAIGVTAQDRPLHLVTLGAPRNGALPGTVPTVLVVCSQHGNEPAGREAGLQLIRDLAFATDPRLLTQLERQAVLVIPSANPDGRAANSRANSQGIDINRDHLNLQTAEAQALAAVVGLWAPSLVLDLHEYGPADPVLYDDDVLYLWPRNLNVDGAVHDGAKGFCIDHLRPACHAAGYSADEYGLQKVGPNIGPLQDLPVDHQVDQIAGDEDEGICRNLMGLRHAMGVLVETKVTASPFHDPAEVGSPGSESPATRLRRVDAQKVVTGAAADWLRDHGEAAKAVTDGAPGRKAREGAERSAPVFLRGADNDPPAPSEVIDPPPARYRLTAAQAEGLTDVFALHGIAVAPDGDAVSVSMGQPAEPVIPLLLDGRARRAMVDGEPVSG